MKVGDSIYRNHPKDKNLHPSLFFFFFSFFLNCCLLTQLILTLSAIAKLRDNNKIYTTHLSVLSLPVHYVTDSQLQVLPTASSPTTKNNKSLQAVKMPNREDITYFGAGPALLPTDVLQRASEALLNFNDTGLGIAEHSHRSELAANIIKEAKEDLATYLDIPEDYEILFMQGGGSGEFSATAYNLVGAWVARERNKVFGELKHDEKTELSEPALMQQLRSNVDKNLKMDYLVTGGWSQKAAAEAARLFGTEHVNIAADGRKENDGKFGKIPEDSTWNLSKDSAFVYYCDNETVDGVEFPGFPKVLEPKADGSGPIVVADMSSNILSRRIPVRNFSLIFFGAQKNLGSTGITVVIIKKDLLPPKTPQPSATLMRQLGLPIPPIILQYETIAKNNSLYNTLSIFE